MTFGDLRELMVTLRNNSPAEHFRGLSKTMDTVPNDVLGHPISNPHFSRFSSVPEPVALATRQRFHLTFATRWGGFGTQPVRSTSTGANCNWFTLPHPAKRGRSAATAPGCGRAADSNVVTSRIVASPIGSRRPLIFGPRRRFQTIGLGTSHSVTSPPDLSVETSLIHGILS
jgi:hypothetical protein